VKNGSPVEGVGEDGDPSVVRGLGSGQRRCPAPPEGGERLAPLAVTTIDHVPRTRAGVRATCVRASLPPATHHEKAPHCAGVGGLLSFRSADPSQIYGVGLAVGIVTGIVTTTAGTPGSEVGAAGPNTGVPSGAGGAPPIGVAVDVGVRVG
jgi:hypothetical protein